ncbi:uncharacterized protein LOC143351442 [Colletes latitarsis]|uniref:uncharacterized protein LOC143351442 n=1 Tax=Colletes latitarsis TaxID=2605962 RepID=UPI0040363F1E
MQLSYKIIIILLALTMVYSDKSSEVKANCNCEYCNEKKNETTTISALYKEDSDGDGNRTICARDRDFNDRTFPSVCHMLCYNRCLILRLSTVTENQTTIRVVTVYRNNYYKLRDGEC